VSEPRVFTVSMERRVRVTINDPDVLERITGPDGDEWRAQIFKLYGEEDVLNHLAANCLVNGLENARLLDGWADLPAEAVRMEPDTHVEPLAVIEETDHAV
jgi:hypothetical protein